MSDSLPNPSNTNKRPGLTHYSSSRLHFSSVSTPNANEQLFYTQVRAAFIQMAINILGLGFLALLYFNYTLINPYITPIWWAVLCSLALRSTKEGLIDYAMRIDFQLDQTVSQFHHTGLSYWFFRFRYLPYIAIKEMFFSFSSSIITPAPTRGIRYMTNRKLSSINQASFLIANSTFQKRGKIILKYLKWIWTKFRRTLKLSMTMPLVLSLSIAWLIISSYDVFPSLLFWSLRLFFFVTFMFFLITTILLLPKWGNRNTIVSLFLVFVCIFIGISFVFVVALKSVQEGMSLYSHTIVLLDTIQAPAKIRLAFTEVLQLDAVRELNQTYRIISDVYYTANGSWWNALDAAQQASKWVPTIIDFNSTFSMWPIVQDSSFLQSATTTLASLSFSVSKSIFTLLGAGLWLGQTLLDVSVSLVVFVLCFYYLLSAHTPSIEFVVSLFPVSVEKQNIIIVSLERNIREIFMSSFKVFLVHVLVTWSSFTVFSVNFAFIAAFIAGLSAMLPIFSSWFVSIPASIWLYFTGNFFGSVVLPIINILSTWIDPFLYDNIEYSHPYWTGLSIVLGISVYGLNGVLMGPLAICLSVTAYHIFQEFEQPESILENSFSIDNDLGPISNDKILQSPSKSNPK